MQDYTLGSVHCSKEKKKVWQCFYRGTELFGASVFKGIHTLSHIILAIMANASSEGPSDDPPSHTIQ